jgi:hypothetical protein
MSGLPSSYIFNDSWTSELDLGRVKRAQHMLRLQFVKQLNHLVETGTWIDRATVDFKLVLKWLQVKLIFLKGICEHQVTLLCIMLA